MEYRNQLASITTTVLANALSELKSAQSAPNKPEDVKSHLESAEKHLKVLLEIGEKAALELTETSL
jgi:hypothetical protein